MLNSSGMDIDKTEQDEGGLVEVSVKKAFLEAAFSGVMDNDNCKKPFKWMGCQTVTKSTV